MPNYSKKIVYLSKVQYQELITNNSVTVNGVTVTYNENDIYVTPQTEPITDVKINNVSIGSNGIANIPIANSSTLGVIKITTSSGFSTYDGNLISVSPDDTTIKAGANQALTLKPGHQHKSVFYGLSKVAGVDLASVTCTLGIYPDASKAAIQNMLGITSLFASEESSTATAAHATNSLFMMNGKLNRATSAIAIGDAVEVGTNCEIVKADEVFVKNTDYATSSQYGIVKLQSSNSLYLDSNGSLGVTPAADSAYKSGSTNSRTVTPEGQHKAVFYGLSKLSGVDLANETVTLGTYPETSKTAIRSLIGAAAESDIPSIPVQDVQVAGTSILNNGTANITKASSTNFGVVKVFVYGTDPIEDGGVFTVNDQLMVIGSNTAKIKSGSDFTAPVTAGNQAQATFFGLSKAAGVNLANETVTFGTYPETSKAAIRSLIGAAAASDIPSVPVQDVQVNATSIVSNGVAAIPLADIDTYGTVKLAYNGIAGLQISNGYLAIAAAGPERIKDAVVAYMPITPINQHYSVFYGLATAAGDTTMTSSSNAVGTYTDSAKTAIRTMLGATSSNVIAVQDEQPTDTDTKVWLPETEAQGIQVPTMEDMANYVQKTDLASKTAYGIVKFGNGIYIDNNNITHVNLASAGDIKTATSHTSCITPLYAKNAIFYGLAAAAGDTTQKISDNAVGTYTTEAKSAIQTMLGVPGDVQVNGTSVVSNGIATIPIAVLTNAQGEGQYGLVKINSSNGITIAGDGCLSVNRASETQYKGGNNNYLMVTPYGQHMAVFYGLAKAAGDTTQSASSNTIGTYTVEAKAAIHTMLGIDPASIAAQVDIPLVETVSGTTPTITGQPNVRYVCGEVSTISITPPASGSVDVIFESGSTATTMTIPSTVKWPAWFDAEALETNTTYEILITDGIYGSVMTWVT